MKNVYHVRKFFWLLRPKKLPHVFSEYVVTQAAGPNTNGVQEAICKNCGCVDEKTYVCLHTVVSEKLTKASCETDGILEFVCNECGAVVNSEQFPAVGHNWTEWKIIQYAHPDVDGIQKRICERCALVDSNTYKFSMSKNAIYVPGTDINAEITSCEMTQNNCDTYDLIYNMYYFGCDGPWILGHKYGTMKYLPQISVGDTIYLSVDRDIRTYKVRISEAAMQNSSWTDIIGNSSGLSVFADMGEETLRMYTCYGSGNGRWIVLATRN